MDYKLLISEQKDKYPFLISNNDSAEKNSMHWCRIFDIEPKTDLFLFLFVFFFILNGIEKMTRTDKKLALVNIKFSMDAYKKLNKNEFNSLSDTALDFFHFVQSFGIKLKILDFVNPWLLEDQI